MGTKNFEKYLIPKGKSIYQAMEQLDRTTARNVFIVNDENVLLGSLSDGDIRRVILKGHSLESLVEEEMNEHPHYVLDTILNKDERIIGFMLELGIEAVPIVNNYGAVVDVVNWLEVFSQDQNTVYPHQENPVFILAGGAGSRLEPFTRILPKPLIPIDDQPILEKIMDKFARFGFDHFILSLGYKAEMIRLYCGDPEIRNKYSMIDYVQESFPLGTIGSLYLARDKLKSSFFISNADIFIEADLGKMLHFHRSAGAILTIVGCLKNNIIPYGVLNMDEQGFLLSIEEKPEYKNIINTGVYIAEPAFIDYIKPDTYQDITDIIAEIMQVGQGISVYPILEEQWFDVGQWMEYERTRKYFESRG